MVAAVVVWVNRDAMFSDQCAVLDSPVQLFWRLVEQSLIILAALNFSLGMHVVLTPCILSRATQIILSKCSYDHLHHRVDRIKILLLLSYAAYSPTQVETPSTDFVTRISWAANNPSANQVGANF